MEVEAMRIHFMITDRAGAPIVSGASPPTPAT
jgi:hypothetical protein